MPATNTKSINSMSIKVVCALTKFEASGVRYSLTDAGGKPKMFRVHEMAIDPG